MKELRHARDNGDPPGLGMQAECKLERRRELSLHQDAADMREQRVPVEFSSVDPAKDDRRSGKDRVAVAQQEVERRPKDGNRHVDLLVRIFPRRKSRRSV